MKKLSISILLFVAFSLFLNAQTVTDFEGNIYQTIQIGNQVWMQENLKSTRYSDGRPLVNGDTIVNISGDYTTPYCFVYRNNPVYKPTYGLLYTWAAVMDGQPSSDLNPSQVQGVCPTGWHLPSRSEWLELVNYVGGTGIAGGMLKVVGTSYWASPNAGATDNFQFSAMPGGLRYPVGNFDQLNYQGDWWTATESTASDSWYSTMYYSNTNVDIKNDYKSNGYSVRCVKDPMVGLLAYYPFNGNARDESGNSYHGTLNGGVQLTADRFGNANAAYSFDGIDDFIYLGNSLSLINGGQDFTLVSWVYLDSDINQYTILGEGSPAVSNYKLFVKNNTPYFTYWSGGTEYTYEGSPGTLSTGKWHQIVVLYMNPTLVYYVDGQQVGTYSTTGAIDNINASLYIGTYDGVSDMFDGMLDDIRIYNQVLTGIEIRNLYQNFHAPSNFNVSSQVDHIRVEWEEFNANDISEYRIYRDGALYYTYDTGIANGILYYKDVAVSPGVTYQYYMTSVDINGYESQQTTTASATFPELGPTLIFSEYAETSTQNNNYLEIYNVSGNTVNLSNYHVLGNYNGSAWSAENSIQLPNYNLAAGDMYIISRNDAAQEILDVADLTFTHGNDLVNGESWVLGFNGNDVRAIAYVVNFDTTIVDVIGDISNYTGDYGSWSVAGDSQGARDRVIRRKSNVQEGNTDWNVSAGTTRVDSEWWLFKKDDFSDLNSHNILTGNSIEELSMTGVFSEFIYDEVNKGITGTYPDNQDVSSVLYNIVASNGALVYLVGNPLPYNSGNSNFTNSVVFDVMAENSSVATWTVDLTSTPYENTEVTLKVNMSQYILNGNFDPTNDYVDVAGEFNDWAGSNKMTDIGDSIYSISIGPQAIGYPFEYKFRINSSWTTGFHDSGDNRIYSTRYGDNVINHWFNYDRPSYELKQPILDLRAIDNENDYSENHNHGTNVNVPFVTDRYDNSGNAFEFNGNSYIELDSVAAYRDIEEVTVSAWVHVGELDRQQRILSHWQSDTIETEKSFMLYQDVANVFTFSVNTANGIKSAICPDEVEYGKWYHVAGVYTQDTVAIVVNGIKTTGEVGYASLIKRSGKMYVGQGGSVTFPDFLMQGKIDEIKVYNRALPMSEINGLYQNYQAPLSFNGSPQVGYISLNWEEKNASNISEYRIYKDGALYFTYSTGIVNGPMTYSDNNVSDGTTYLYYMTSVDINGYESQPTNTISVTFGAPPILTISGIQYTENADGSSDYQDQVVTTSGIVTVKNTTQYFIQDGYGAWNGLYVYDTNNPEIGDSITITGTVTEYYGMTEIKDLTSFTKVSSGNALPVPALVTTAMANLEEYEGVFLRINNAVCTNPDPDPGSGEWIVDDGSGGLRIGDIFYVTVPSLGEAYNITGALSFSFEMFKLNPRSVADIEIYTGPLNLSIYDIQYTTNIDGSSNYQNEVIVTSGVVTATSLDRFIIQDGNGSWNGLSVFDGYNPVIGDLVSVTGSVIEYKDLTQIRYVTEITTASQGNTLPDPIVASTVDANNEEYEGVLLKVNKATVTNIDLGYGQWLVNDGSGSLRVDDTFFPYTPALNDVYDITGPITNLYGTFRINPRDNADIVVSAPNSNPQVWLNSPDDGINVRTDTLRLKWGASDDDGDQLYFDVYYGTASPNTLVAQDISNTEFLLTGLQPGQQYYWMIQVKDPYVTVDSEIRTFYVDEFGTITGTINDQNGNPIDQLKIYLYDYNLNLINSFDVDQGATGGFSLKLDPGDYYLEIGGQGTFMYYYFYSLVNAQTESIIQTFYKIGDYEGNGVVDYNDLNAFISDDWHVPNFNSELGPISGILPNAWVEPDMVVDFEDLMVFTMAWNIANTKSELTFGDISTQFGSGKIKLIENDGILEVFVENSPSMSTSRVNIEFPDNIDLENIRPFVYDESIIMLIRQDNDNSIFELNFGNLKKSEMLPFIHLASIDLQSEQLNGIVNYEYNILDQTGQKSKGFGELILNEPFVYIYPNPVKLGEPVKAYIEYVNSNSVQITITNIDGKNIEQLVFECSKGEIIEIPTDNLQQGIYFIKISSGKTEFKKKIMID